MVKDRYERVDRPRVKAEISAVDTAEVKTFEGGCRFLRSWYREKFWNWSSPRPDDWPLCSRKVPNVSAHAPQFTILRSNKERTLYDSFFFPTYTLVLILHRI